MYRLSGNEHPVPPVPQAQAAIRDRAGEVHRYPDWHTTALTEALAARLKVPAAHVVTGVGSVAVTQQLIQATRGRGEDVVYAWRSFEAYPHLCEINGARAVPVPLREERHDLDAMADAVTASTRLVVVCNPNNPTGTVVRRTELERLLARVPQEVPVVLDEAYHEFVTDPDVPDGIDLYRDHPHLVVLRTFSKAYGLAGLRVGYAVAQPPIAEAVRACGVPFGVSDLGQAAAVAALGAEDVVRDRIGTLVGERDRLAAGLRELGWRVPPTEANFCWLRLGERADAFARAAQAAGVLVRSFGGEGVRITVGEPAANRTVLRVAADFASEASDPLPG